MLPQPLLHSLHHWYYPPLVHGFVTKLESTSRGYVDRLDTYNLTKVLKHKLEKRDNKMSDEAGHMAKKAKVHIASQIGPSNNQELRHLTDAGAVPDWFPEIQQVWKQAMNHIDHNDLAPQTSHCFFVLPPIHLFWGGQSPNQHIYYFHYLLLFNEIKKWRFILGNTYWKTKWPIPNTNNPSAFDPDVFWKYGGPLLFGDERSADIAAGHYNPTSQLSCHCNVHLDTADNTNIRQVVLYNLNSFHMLEEIKEMECLLFPTDLRGNGDISVLKSRQLWRCGICH
ncbi:hypothetical protein V8E53_014374 [Lactarius tabidus]